MALNTGKIIVRRSWDVIPMPDTVITRVNALGRYQPELMIFTDRRGHPIGDVKIPGVETSNTDHIEIRGVDASDIVFQTVKLLNFFSTKGVISDTLSPKTIISGDIIDNKK